MAKHYTCVYIYIYREKYICMHIYVHIHVSGLHLVIGHCLVWYHFRGLGGVGVRTASHTPGAPTTTFSHVQHPENGVAKTSICCCRTKCPTFNCYWLVEKGRIAEKELFMDENHPDGICCKRCFLRFLLSRRRGNVFIVVFCVTTSGASEISLFGTSASNWLNGNRC